MKRVLMIEDHPEDLELLGIILERFGYVPIGASNGEDAVQILEAVAIDVLLCDLCLPRQYPSTGVSALEGLKLIQDINLKYPRIPVIGMTALLKDEAIRATKSVQLDWLLNKPFEVGELERALRTVCSRASALLEQSV